MADQYSPGTIKWFDGSPLIESLYKKGLLVNYPNTGLDGIVNLSDEGRKVAEQCWNETNTKEKSKD